MTTTTPIKLTDAEESFFDFCEEVLRKYDEEQLHIRRGEILDLRYDASRRLLETYGEYSDEQLPLGAELEAVTSQIAAAQAEAVGGGYRKLVMDEQQAAYP